MNPVPTHLSYFFKINFNITFPFRSSKQPVSFTFCHQNLVWIYLLSACHMLCPSHYPWFDNPNYTWWGSINLKNSTLCMFLYPHVLKSPLFCPYIFLNTRLKEAQSICSTPSVRHQILRAYKTACKFILLCNLRLYVFRCTAVVTRISWIWCPITFPCECNIDCEIRGSWRFKSSGIRHRINWQIIIVTIYQLIRCFITRYLIC